MKEDGDCFEIAGHMIMDIDIPNALLCHGNPTGQGEIKGIIHGHAWIEINNIVLDFSNGKRVVMSKRKYYGIGKIQDVKRYTKKEAVAKMLETEHFGPWDLVDCKQCAYYEHEDRCKHPNVFKETAVCSSKGVYSVIKPIPPSEYNKNNNCTKFKRSKKMLKGKSEDKKLNKQIIRIAKEKGLKINNFGCR